MKALLLILLTSPALALGALDNAEASARLQAPVTDAREEYGALIATLIEDHCFGAVCVPAKGQVHAKVNGKQVTLQQVSARQPFKALGCTWVAGETLWLYLEPPNHSAEGTLAKEVDVGGELVAGHVRLQFEAGKPSRVLEGTLRRPVTLDGWQIPAGYSLRRLEGNDWSAQQTEAAAPGAVLVHTGKDSAVPARATLVTHMGGVDVQYTLVERFTVGPVTFGPGLFTITPMPNGERHYLGTLGQPVKLEGLSLAAGASVGWCDRDGLQEASGDGLTFGTATVAAQRVTVVRPGPTVSGHKGEACVAGPVKSFKVDLGRPCSCGGHQPSPRIVELSAAEVASDGKDTRHDLRRAFDEVRQPCDCSGGPRP